MMVGMLWGHSIMVMRMGDIMADYRLWGYNMVVLMGGE